MDDALNAFEVTAKVVNWTVGPTVTQFEIELGRGVKVNKITNLTDDLKLQLAARDIRIEAPIPGKIPLELRFLIRIRGQFRLVKLLNRLYFKKVNRRLRLL